MEQSKIIRYMSKKLLPLQFSVCIFLGRIKNETYNHKSWKDVSVEQFIDEVNEYLR